MDMQEILGNFSQEVYFFILKKVKEKDAADDIFQSTCLKACERLHQIREEKKSRAWLFQIARNEIADHYRQGPLIAQGFGDGEEGVPVSPGEYGLYDTGNLCCLDHFITELPGIYRAVIELVYQKGNKQKEAAQILDISLPNVKARIRRAQTILKSKFRECCHYHLDRNGKLTGEPDCVRCNAAL